MKEIILIICLFLVNFVHSCSDSWTTYKTVNEGPYSSSLNLFRVNRSTRIRCIDSGLEFQTTRSLQPPDLGGGWTYRANRGFGDCRNSCNSLNISVEAIFQKRRFIFSERQTLSFDYVNKNCDKLYWSNWNEDSTCITSSKAIYMRNCTDCDGDVFPFQQYCDGNTTRMEPCQPSWSEWGEAGPCKSPTCNSTGEHVRRRKCLYGDGSEADNIRLCSNESNIMMEQCIVNTTKLGSCQPSWSEWGEAGPCMSPTCNPTGERVRTRKCLYGDGSEAVDNQLCSYESNILTEQCLINTTICRNRKSLFEFQTYNNLRYVWVGVALGILTLLSIVLIFCILKYRQRIFPKLNFIKSKNRAETTQNIYWDFDNGAVIESATEVEYHQPASTQYFTENCEQTEDPFASDHTYASEDHTVYHQSVAGDDCTTDVYSMAQDVTSQLESSPYASMNSFKQTKLSIASVQCLIENAKSSINVLADNSAYANMTPNAAFINPEEIPYTDMQVATQSNSSSDDECLYVDVFGL